MYFERLHFHITRKCTNKCIHCSVVASPYCRTQLNLDGIKHVIDESILAGVKFIELSGGEPLTIGKSTLLYVIRYASKKGLFPSILSNATLLAPQLAEELVDAGLGRIEVSIYGATEETHSVFTRTPASLNRTLQGIRSACKAGLEVIVNIVVTPSNLNEISAIPSLLEGCEITAYTFASIVPSGRGEALKEYIFTDKELPHVIDLLERDFPENNYLFLNSLFPSVSPSLKRYCSRVFSDIVVDCKGQVIPCCLLPSDLRRSLGNLQKTPIQEVLSKSTVFKDPVFRSLYEGQGKLVKRFKETKISNNLCRTCIILLRKLLSEEGS